MYTKDIFYLYDSEVALPKQEVAEILNRIKNNNNEININNIRNELSSLLESSQFDWVKFLWNEDMEIFPAATQDEAKRWVVENVWNLLFDDEYKFK